MIFILADAVKYVDGIDLKGTPRSLTSMDAAADAGAVFDAAKSQAQVVGSGVFAFEQGVDSQVREAISDSTLLAQLHANKQVQFQTDPEGWFSIYGEVLANIGWVLQDFGWSDYTADGQQAEVNEKVLALISVALGPSPAALTVLTATIDALRGLDSSSSWITIFSRETQRADMARFQIGLVSTGANDDVFVTFVCCILKAQNDVTQVLWLKWKQAHATFKACSQKVTINRESVVTLGPAIRAKIRAYQADYISSIKDL